MASCLDAKLGSSERTRTISFSTMLSWLEANQHPFFSPTALARHTTPFAFEDGDGTYFALVCCRLTKLGMFFAAFAFSLLTSD